MRLYGILGKQQGKLVIPFRLLIFKVFFYSRRDFGVYLSVLFFRAIMMCTVSENQRRFFSLPRKPLGSIVHGLWFLPDNVPSIRCNYLTMQQVPLSVKIYRKNLG